MRIVIDCNVVVAAARTPGVCRTVLVRAVADHEIVLSPPIVAEYREVGRRPKHRPYRETMDTVTDLLERVAIVVEPDHPPFGLPDPDDEIYLVTAVVAGAQALVTGNLRHFPQVLCGTVAILTPRQFLDRCG